MLATNQNDDVELPKGNARISFLPKRPERSLETERPMMLEKETGVKKRERVCGGSGQDQE